MDKLSKEIKDKIDKREKFYYHGDEYTPTEIKHDYYANGKVITIKFNKEDNE